MDNDSLDLQFGPGSPSGFTPTGIASFSDLRPAAVVRELIQNSLDAAVEAKEETAIVRFRLTRSNRRSVPGMKSYRKAFNAAVRTHEDLGGGTLPSQAERVVQVMRKAAKGDEQDILSVLDNGIGLDNARMTALLSDGISAKGGAATGTFGNGHSVAIPASDLRYVLYGGVTANGDRIGAGHAVIASRKVRGEQFPKSGDGFLVKGFRKGSYDYAKGASLPGLITENLDEIEQQSGHGTAVIITGFNNFRESLPLWDMVSKAAACNFFPPIDEGRLVVQAEDHRPGQSSTIKTLDHSTLKAVLEENRNEQRSKAFLSGQKAFDAHGALQFGTPHVFRTKLGEIRVQIRERSSGNPRVDLCRNGMWITDDKNIPGFYYRFQDRKPFHALLLLDSQSGGRLHELVRNAEGPLHDKLDAKQRLSKPEERELRDAFGEIREWLRSVVPELETDSYSPDDFLALDFGEDGTGTGGNARQSFWGSPVPVTRRDPGLSYEESSPGPGPGPPGPHPPKPPGPRPPRPRPVLRPFFQATSVPLGLNHRQILLECQQGCKNAELRLYVDENVDATCDSLRRDQIETAYLTEVDVCGHPVNSSKLVRQNGRIVGVRLGDIAADSSLDIDGALSRFPIDSCFSQARSRPCVWKFSGRHRLMTRRSDQEPACTWARGTASVVNSAASVVATGQGSRRRR